MAYNLYTRFVAMTELQENGWSLRLAFRGKFIA